MSKIEAHPVDLYTLDPTDRQGVSAEGDWVVERTTYLTRPRPKSKFRTVLKAGDILSAKGSQSTVETRVNSTARAGETALAVTVKHQLTGGQITEALQCVRLSDADGRLRAGEFLREFHGPDGARHRHETAELGVGIGDIPTSSYPEVMLPFLIRGLDLKKKRALYAWINDRFIARMYLERRSTKMVSVPMGRMHCQEMWMYPDLNDWIALGAVVTRLAKPLLPRYVMQYEIAAPHRLVRFEGAYGPPGAPEVVLELAGEGWES